MMISRCMVSSLPILPWGNCSYVQILKQGGCTTVLIASLWEDLHGSSKANTVPATVFLASAAASKHKDRVCGRSQNIKMRGFFSTPPKVQPDTSSPHCILFFPGCCILLPQHEMLQVQSILVYLQEAINTKIKKETQR